MPTKTFNQSEKGIKIRHKETGLVYKSDDGDFLSYNSEKFEELGRTDLCTLEQRTEIRLLMEMHGKDIGQLCDKYKKQSLKDFTYQDCERLIKFLKEL